MLHNQSIEFQLIKLMRFKNRTNDLTEKNFLCTFAKRNVNIKEKKEATKSLTYFYQFVTPTSLRTKENIKIRKIRKK